MNKNPIKLKINNLALLGLSAILIATMTTAISLYLYHDSGDIYLDRSRPGFLPDKEETKEEKNETPDYSFSDSGKMAKEDFEIYLKNFNQEFDRLEKYSVDPFSMDSLSDESLGIPNE